MTLWHIKLSEGDDLFTLANSEEEALKEAKKWGGTPTIRDVVPLKDIYGLIWSEGYCVGLKDAHIEARQAYEAGLDAGRREASQ